MSSSLESASSLQESDSDEELAPFVPVDTTLDPKTANAPDVNMLSVPESDDDTTGHTPECMTPLTRSDYSDHDDLESDEGLWNKFSKLFCNQEKKKSMNFLTQY